MGASCPASGELRAWGPVGTPSWGRWPDIWRRAFKEAATTLVQLVQGNNTQVIGTSYLDVLAVKVGCDAMGAVANETQFTLR